MKRLALGCLILSSVCLAGETRHPALFLEKGNLFSAEEFAGESLPKSIELRSGSTGVASNGVLTVVNGTVDENPTARPVIHYNEVADEFICHMRLKMDGEGYTKSPWIDIGGQHRNHFRFNDRGVLFSSEAKPLAERRIDNRRSGNMLPLNEWLHVTVEIKKGKIGLSINGRTEIYEDGKIEIGDSLKIGMKAIPGGEFHVDYVRIWEVKK